MNRIQAHKKPAGMTCRLWLSIMVLDSSPLLSG
jgi:hypothetical protein